VCEEVIEPAALAKAIRPTSPPSNLLEGEGDVALALRWQGAPSYERIAAFAEASATARQYDRAQKRSTSCLTAISPRRSALSCAKSCWSRGEILAIDGVMLRDFDYIDLGRIRMPSYTVPVTIKSLVFSEDPQAGRPQQRIHHHDHEHGHDHAHDHHHHHGDHHHGHDHAHAARVTAPERRAGRVRTHGP